ncbi:MAG: hypothetical protein KA479_13950 [Saprospiraceae bacterium]|nr:hypothetical protein [Saprospiraceae bacterium]
MKKFSLIFFCLVSTIVQAQNVGINTDTPVATLHVEGGSDPEIALFKRQDTTLNMKLCAGSNELRLGLSASRGMIGTGNPLNLAFRTNNTDRMTIDGYSGNVGIGVTAPSVRLDVLSNSEFPVVAQFVGQTPTSIISVLGGANGIQMGVNENTSFIRSTNVTDLDFQILGYSKMVIKPSGMVGIGLPDPDHQLFVRSPNKNVAMFQSAVDSSVVRTGTFNSFLAMGIKNGGHGYIGTETANDFALRTNGINRLYIKNSIGYIGINTTNPLSPLDVNLLGSGTTGRFASTGAVSDLKVLNSQDYAILGCQTNMSYVGSGTNIPLSFLVSGTMRMLINTTGQVSIGTFTPGAKFHVFDPNPNQTLGLFQGSGGYSQIYVKNNVITTDLGADQTKGYVGTNSDHDFAVRAGGDTRMYLKYSNSCVGIGTINPQYRLHVFHPGSNAAISNFEVAAGFGEITVSNPTQQVDLGVYDTGGYLGTLTEGDLNIRTAGATKIFIKHSNGNVGINTVTPAKKLDVNGDAKINGELTVNSIAQSGTTGVSFNANFSNYGGGYENVTYYKDMEGRVHLSGLVAINGTQSGTMFTLPAGYHPTGQLIFLVMSGSGPARIDVMTNGNVSIATPVPGWISTNEISFRAGN